MIMVECGIPPKEILKGMIGMVGVCMDSVEACLVTHYHSDHSKSIREVYSWGVPVFASEETLRHWGSKGTALEPFKPTRIADGVMALAFPVMHDAEGSMGFVIKTKDETILFVNDCKRWEADLSAIKPDYVFIECNYWEKQVYAQISSLRRAFCESAPDSQERRESAAMIKQLERNVNAHMSLAGCIRSLKRLNLSKCRSIFLMHMSDGNANEYEMKDAVGKATGVQTLVCKKKGGIK